MKVLILHDLVAASAPPEAQDTLVQAAAIERALRELGHITARYALDGDLGRLRAHLEASRPSLVFNLVESLAGSDAAAVAAAALLDGLGLRYTGSPAAAIATTNDKCAAKALLVRLGLPTPEWVVSGRRSHDGEGGEFRAGRYIIKCRFEHASVGLEEDAIEEFTDADTLLRAVNAASRRHGRPCFGERFIDGREFNLSVMEGRDGLSVLPPAEIDFSAFPPGKVHLVGYRAKWDESSFEYHNTPRRFAFPPKDVALLEQLEDLARTTFDALQLAGYARVDFRVDRDGPWILEINTNPCIAPDAGFAAALDEAGIAYNDAIGRIVQAALKDD